MRILQYALWLGPAAVQATLMGVMLRKGLRAKFPLFFSYLTFELLSFAVLFFTYHYAYGQYFYFYWVCGALGAGLGFAAIYEAFGNAMEEYKGLRQVGSVLFRWVMLLLVIVAVLSAATSQGSDASRIVSGVITFDRSLRLMQCGLVLFLVLFARHLGLSLRHHCFAVAVGFGAMAAVDLIILTLRAHWGYVGDTWLSLTHSAAYNCIAILWLGTLLSPEPQRQPAEARDSVRWNLALSAAGADEEPFLPYLERTVERVLSRKQNHIRGI